MVGACVLRWVHASAGLGHRVWGAWSDAGARSGSIGSLVLGLGLGHCVWALGLRH